MQESKRVKQGKQKNESKKAEQLIKENEQFMIRKNFSTKQMRNIYDFKRSFPGRGRK